MTGRPLTEQEVRHFLNHSDGVDALDLKLLCEDWLRQREELQRERALRAYLADCAAVIVGAPCCEPYLLEKAREINRAAIDASGEKNKELGGYLPRRYVDERKTQS